MRARPPAGFGLVALCAALLAGFPGPGLAAALVKVAPKATAPAPTPPPPLPPYEPQLLRLAEIMGALTYLRDLCGDGDGNQWRAKMSNLLDTEATTESSRDLLAGAYNQGFHGYQITYRVCTSNAQLIINRFLDEGGQIARDVANRFGGG